MFACKDTVTHPHHSIKQAPWRETKSLSLSLSLSHARTHARTHACTHTHTHTRLTALFPGLPGWVGTRKVKPIWIMLKQETVSGSGISWDICKSAPHSRQITMPAPHRSVFYRPDAFFADQPTASQHWRQKKRENWRETKYIKSKVILLRQIATACKKRNYTVSPLKWCRKLNLFKCDTTQHKHVPFSTTHITTYWL